jgi:hypothetical protein
MAARGAGRLAALLLAVAATAAPAAEVGISGRVISIPTPPGLCEFSPADPANRAEFGRAAAAMADTRELLAMFVPCDRVEAMRRERDGQRWIGPVVEVAAAKAAGTVRLFPNIRRSLLAEVASRMMPAEGYDVSGIPGLGLTQASRQESDERWTLEDMELLSADPDGLVMRATAEVAIRRGPRHPVEVVHAATLVRDLPLVIDFIDRRPDGTPVALLHQHARYMIRALIAVNEGSRAPSPPRPLVASDDPAAVAGAADGIAWNSPIILVGGGALLLGLITLGGALWWLLSDHGR